MLHTFQDQGLLTETRRHNDFCHFPSQFSLLLESGPIFMKTWIWTSDSGLRDSLGRQLSCNSGIIPQYCKKCCVLGVQSGPTNPDCRIPILSRGYCTLRQYESSQSEKPSTGFQGNSAAARGTSLRAALPVRRGRPKRRVLKGRSL